MGNSFLHCVSTDPAGWPIQGLILISAFILRWLVLCLWSIFLIGKSLQKLQKGSHFPTLILGTLEAGTRMLSWPHWLTPPLPPGASSPCQDIGKGSLAKVAHVHLSCRKSLLFPMWIQNMPLKVIPRVTSNTLYKDVDVHFKHRAPFVCLYVCVI